MAISQYVGARIRRIEDPRLIRGEGIYLDDLRLPGTLYTAVVRSPQAHARITGIDLLRARAHPGVVAALAAADFGAKLPRVAGPEETESTVPDQFALARDRVRYVGEPVAVIVADSLYAAHDAADLVRVSYDPLPAVVDLDVAVEPEAPLLHEHLGTNIAFTKTIMAGKVDETFAAAEIFIRQRMAHQRLAAVSLEGRGVAAQWEDGRLTMWNSTQCPHEIRDLVAGSLGLPEEAVRLIAPDVGGGFGAKLHVYPEDLFIPLIARRLARPVVWIESRQEHLAATCHGRGQVADIEIAARRDGTVLGLRIRVLADLGAYLMRYTVDVPGLTVEMIQGPYLIETIDMTLTGVYTNKVPTGPYRGAGRPEATYYLERIMDLVAREIGLDPAMVRERNFIPPDRFPYKSVGGPRYDSGDYRAALRKALEIADYTELRRRQADRRARGERPLGIGLSSYVEICAFGPMEFGGVRINEDGTVTVRTGTSPHGQGAATGFAQIVADTLGVPLDQISVVHGDTAIVPKGHGTSGSRSMAVGGVAIFQAAQAVRDQVLKVAAGLLEASTSDLMIEHGEVRVAGVPTPALSVKQIAEAVYQRGDVPGGVVPELAATHEYAVKRYTFPFGTHLCVAEVDPETGAVQILRHVAVDDCGKVINPLLVAGQVHGGIAQGLAQALYEEMVFDEQGQMLTGSLMDYAVPKAAMMPPFVLDRTTTPTPNNPLGVKGIGEAATIGSTPAVVNAVMDALREYGVRHLDMPLTSQKVWRAIQKGSIQRE